MEDARRLRCDAHGTNQHARVVVERRPHVIVVLRRVHLVGSHGARVGQELRVVGAVGLGLPHDEEKSSRAPVVLKRWSWSETKELANLGLGVPVQVPIDAARHLHEPNVAVGDELGKVDDPLDVDPSG